jgi:putative ABC transport system permease protein
MGFRGLFLRKLRSLLSTLGIVFGVAAVISMLSIGEGARREAIEQIKLLGTNNIRVKQVLLRGERGEEAERRLSSGVSYGDAMLIRERVPGLLGVAPLKFLGAEIRFEGRQGIAQVIGTTPEHEGVTNFRVARGRYITEFDLVDAKRVCVLGAEVKQELFGYRDAIGASIRIGDGWFAVVGVMESKTIQKRRATAVKIRNLNRDVYIPITTALGRFSATGSPPGVQEIAIRVIRAEGVAPAARAIRRILGRVHKGVKDYEVMVPEELLAQAQRTQRIFNLVMGSIAGISLLVGGIGVMNIMLANISERTREIGIRRAVGATKTDIVGQFLVETVFICLAGGVIGILLGFGMANVVTLYAGWQTGFSMASVLIAFGTSASVGLIFGLFPARRAAQLNPVQALRFE